MTLPARHRAPVAVRGGAAGLYADPDALRAMAGTFGASAHHVLATARYVHGYLFDADVATAALLDPLAFAAAETRVLLALDGPGGLVAAGCAAHALDGDLRRAALAYLDADRLPATTDHLPSLSELPHALGLGTRAFWRTRSFGAAGGAVLAADPGLTDAGVDLVGMSLVRYGSYALPDGRAEVADTGIDRGAAASSPPRRLTDIIGDLARRCADPRHGEIDVRILTLPDGERRVICDITGTKSWDPLPTHDVTSLATNARALVGRPSAYEQGVLLALRRAGVRREDPVMLVGHSEGGLVAVNAARTAVERGDFDVTHVITAGAPVGRTVGRLPATVEVLALENAPDVVPHLDGVANPELRNVVTATSRAGDGSVPGDHDVERSYLPVAADVQASDNRSITEFLDSAEDYLRAEHVVTHTFQVRRS